MTKTLQPTNHYCKSPLNYIGGKYKILPQLLPLFPAQSDIFLDLFCGGCNVGINIENLALQNSNTTKHLMPQAQKLIFNDNLTYLIDLYKYLQCNALESTLQAIDNIISKYKLDLQNAQGYCLLRDDYNAHKSPILLFVLIAFSFNHQIRFNNAHKFNNPFGKNRSSFNPAMRNHLINFVKALQNKPITFSSLNFEKALDSVALNRQSFVYADPPYLITQGTYNDGKRGFSGWNEQLEKRLLYSLKFLDSQGIKFALSNVLSHKGKHNEILQQWIYTNDYVVYSIKSHYTNANYQTKYKDKNLTKEVLITNYESSKALCKGDSDALYW